MYILATTTKYEKNTKYYSKSGNTYTLLVLGTDYTLGSNIPNGIYEETRYDRIYIRQWGTSGTYKQFPYFIDDESTLPEHDMSANDVDLDSYTNTAGRTVRNRVRHDVAAVEIPIPTMSGAELHNLFDFTTDVWLECFFFYEPSWNFVSKKMYRNATIKYHRYYIDDIDPNKNVYTEVQFGLVEE